MNARIVRNVIKTALCFTAMTVAFVPILGLSISPLANAKLYDNFEDETLKKETYSMLPTRTKWTGSENEDEWKNPAKRWNDIYLEKDAKIYPFTYEDRKNFGKLIINSPDQDVLDGSFNQSAYQGIVNFAGGDKADGTEFTPEQDDKYWWTPDTKWNKKITGQTKSDLPAAKPASAQDEAFVNVYKESIENEKYKTLTLTGFFHLSPMMKLLKNHKDVFDKAGYIFIDGAIENNNHVASSQFRCDQSSFLSALATCQYLSMDNFDHYIKKGPLKVATFGGICIPPVTVYMGGFQNGISYFNNHLLPIIAAKKGWTAEETEKHKVFFVSLGERDSYFTGSFVIGDATPITKKLLAENVSAIIPVASIQVYDVIKEIRNQRSDCIVIGVDTEMEAKDADINAKSTYTAKGFEEGEIYNRDNNAQFKDTIIKFSAVKNMTRVTSMVNYLSSRNRWVYPLEAETNPSIEIEYGSFGFLNVGNLKNKGCYLSGPGLLMIGELFKQVYPESQEKFADAEKIYQWINNDPAGKAMIDKYVDKMMDFKY